MLFWDKCKNVEATAPDDPLGTFLKEELIVKIAALHILTCVQILNVCFSAPVSSVIMLNIFEALQR